MLKENLSVLEFLIFFSGIEFINFLNSSFLIHCFRYKIISEGRRRFDIEGLNSVKYKLISTEIKPLYTKFLVYYDKNETLNSIKN